MYFSWKAVSVPLWNEVGYRQTDINKLPQDRLFIDLCILIKWRVLFTICVHGLPD